MNEYNKDEMIQYIWDEFLVCDECKTIDKLINAETISKMSENVSQ